MSMSMSMSNRSYENSFRSINNNHSDSVVDVDYVSANNDASLQSARMALSMAEQGEIPIVPGGSNNTNMNMNTHNNYNPGGMAAASSSNNNNSYNNMMHPQPGNFAGGFRRLHRDYLKDLEDDVVMGLPWPTPADRREVSDLLRRRSLSGTRANQISTCVFGYWILSIGFWLLYGVVLGADIQHSNNNNSNNNNSNNGGGSNSHDKGMLPVLLGLSYVLSLFVLMYGHVRYYRLDGRVQRLVRAIMDANGLGYQDPYGEGEHGRAHELHRNDANQTAQFRLPEFVDVILRTVAAEDGNGNNNIYSNNNNGINHNNTMDDEVSAVTFRDSIMKSVTSGSAGTKSGAPSDTGAVPWLQRIGGYGR